ncbi:MAG: hypothetical protein K2X39_04510, partial [Silvanigrellaceae bacterium]|nr:hypothetical protein [Silvanigrellaceae bacterium]
GFWQLLGADGKYLRDGFSKRDEIFKLRRTSNILYAANPLSPFIQNKTLFFSPRVSNTHEKYLYMIDFHQEKFFKIPLSELPAEADIEAISVPSDANKMLFPVWVEPFAL